MEPMGPPVVTRVDRERRIPNDELRPPILNIKATLAAGERRNFDVSDLRCIWFCITSGAAAGVTVQFGDDGVEIPFQLTGSAGTNFMRLPSGVRRLIVTNTSAGPLAINWFYSAGRDFFVSFSQASG